MDGLLKISYHDFKDAELFGTNDSTTQDNDKMMYIFNLSTGHLFKILCIHFHGWHSLSITVFLDEKVGEHTSGRWYRHPVKIEENRQGLH